MPELCGSTGKVLVRINPKFYRPAEVDKLIGNPAKAKAKLGWASKTTLEELMPDDGGCGHSPE